MFSIAAINDTDAKHQWEPLAPTKEAQEFRLSQIYQEGLLKLQEKEYEKARELLESVLKDDLLPNGQVDNCGSDGHLLQLRFLTLKNLATVFLQQGSSHYESALHCYLQAVDIDSKDSVVWNQLGTLSCSMGLLSISRWAFEQGLLCSPNNWNCMEKLLEVLIAIGDEVACLSVAELILRHWPSHSRALHVKNVIKESEPTPFAPRGIDKLEPKHIRLKFLDKRKATSDDIDESGITKKSNQNIILNLPEASWIALAGELLAILNESFRSADVRLIIRLPDSDNINNTPTKNEAFEHDIANKETNNNDNNNNNNNNLSEEPHQERRSSRLRSRKPDKEESEITANKDLVKLVPQFLEPFITVESEMPNSSNELTCNTQNNESLDVTKFVYGTSKNYGAYHISHLLLEEIAHKGILYRDTFIKFLELEELTRNSGKNRTFECSLFLAELAFDFGVQSSDRSTMNDFMLKASYHLCKVIESVALNQPIDGSILDTKRQFWVRFYWLSGKLSSLNGDKEKARKEFGVSLALFTPKETEKEKSSFVSISLPHLKVTNELTVDFILHEINLLEVDFLMKNSVSDMIENDLHSECIKLLAPLVFCMKDDQNILDNKDGEGVTSAELSALNVLIKACEKSKPMDADVYLKCHKQKLRILMAANGVKLSNLPKLKFLEGSETEVNENSRSTLDPLLSEEVREISQCTLEMKNSISPCGSINDSIIPMRIIGDIQSLLVAVMSHISNTCFSKKSLAVDDLNEKDKREKNCFVDAAIAFFRLQHLNLNVPVKTQVELIIAIHDMLAEYGLCCASGDGEEDGSFLKLAIKHLLYLDMKLKSTQCESNVEVEKEVNNQLTESGKDLLSEEDKEDLEIEIDTALDQCFFCLYGLHLRSDSSYEDDLANHKNTSRGDYQTKEQCADVFQYILPYAKASSRTGLVKLRRVLRAIRKHFPQPPESALDGNAIEKFLDDPNLCENKLSEEAGSDEFRDSIMNVIDPNGSLPKKQPTTNKESSEPYMDVYRNLYYLLAQSEETSATDKWAGFVLTKEGEEFVQQTAKLSKYDLLFNPLRFESWQRLATIYDEEVDLLLNDGSKQINVTGWRKNASFAQRVDTSRRRSRRCLLMTLALAKTPIQQGEIHDLLALVYYDGLQNVVPIYDQRLNLPVKDAEWKTFCQNSMKHFEKAFAQKEDWSYAYYIGKLSEKLGYSREKSFAYYDKAISLNPSAVDPFYRMHASRLKLLWSCAQNDKEVLKIAATYSFDQSTKETVMKILDETNSESSPWHMLYNDCLSALQICVEGDLKHFHKARYMLAQGLYRKGENGDLEKAKDELSFCFKSSRSSFTINMWEIDSMVKKGRRKTPGMAGNKKALEVNLAESSRKFITCIRKYILFYMKLLEETGDISTLERAYISIRADKRFSLCLEDFVPIALGRYIKALISSINQIEINTNNTDNTALEHLLEKMFSLYMEQMNLWSDICNLPEIKCPELSEASLFGYLFKYIQILETNCKLEALEGINEKMRKRLKNPKLANTNCAKVHKHVSIAWCRCLVISMASLTPLNPQILTEPQFTLDNTSLSNQLLCIDLHTHDLWQSSFEDANHLKSMETKWNDLLVKMKDVLVIKRPSEENMEAAIMLLRSAYNYYRDSSCGLLPSFLNLYAVPCQQATDGQSQSQIQSKVEIVETITSKKLLIWAYALLHGRCVTNVAVIIKYCEENVKSKTKKGGGILSTPPTPTMHSVLASQTGKDTAGTSSGKETTLSTTVDPTEIKNTEIVSSKADMATNCEEAEVVTPVKPNEDPAGENRKILSAVPLLLQCNSADTIMSNPEESQTAEGADCTKT